MVSTDISTLVKSAIYNHREELHSNNSVISKINTDIVDVDFSMTPAEWKTVDVQNNCIFVSNDMVSEILFGNENNVGISVYTNNFIKSDTPKFNYIIKRYTSGITELYILLDTTNTYYINHIEGAGWSTPGTDYVRKNLERFGRNVSEISYDLEHDNPIELYKSSISVLLD